MSSSSTPEVKRSSPRLDHGKRGLKSKDALTILNLYQNKDGKTTDFDTLDYEKFLNLGYAEQTKGDPRSEKLILFDLLVTRNISSIHFCSRKIAERDSKYKSFDIDPEEPLKIHMSNDDDIDAAIEFLKQTKMKKKDQAAKGFLKKINRWYENNKELESYKTAVNFIARLDEGIEDALDNISDFEALVEKADKDSKKYRRYTKNLADEEEKKEKLEGKRAKHLAKYERVFSKSFDEISTIVMSIENSYSSSSNTPQSPLQRSLSHMARDSNKKLANNEMLKKKSKDQLDVSDVDEDEDEESSDDNDNDGNSSFVSDSDDDNDEDEDDDIDDDDNSEKTPSKTNKKRKKRDETTTTTTTTTTRATKTQGKGNKKKKKRKKNRNKA